LPSDDLQGGFVGAAVAASDDGVIVSDPRPPRRRDSQAPP
jgi:hypothetical protein